jgi:protein-S-isoprenylcysteine O-methyltransferase Ste14
MGLAMIGRLLLRNLMWFVVLAALLFLPAGTWRWPSAWAFLVLSCGMAFLRHLWLVRNDPALYHERMKAPVQRSQLAADKWLMMGSMLLLVGWFVLMGLEVRFGGAPRFTVLAQALGAIGVVAGFQLGLVTLKTNSFAAPAVKVQLERSQRIVCNGPYRIVRHPMYAAAMLVFISTPVLLGSLWGLIGAPVFALVLAVRAVLEERVLRETFSDYAEYMGKVRYRLVPLVW